MRRLTKAIILSAMVAAALAASCRESGPGSWEIVSFEDLVATNPFAGKPGKGREVLAAVPDDEGGVCVVYHDRSLELGRWSREGVATEHQVVDPDVVYTPDSVVLVLDRDGRPHVAFADRGRKKIRYAFWDGEKWTRADVLAYAESYGYGKGMPYLSMALDSRSRPHILLFREATDPTGRREGLQSELTYARREGAGWVFEAVDSWPNKFGCSNSEGGWAEIAMAEGDVPHVCYCALADWDGVFKYGVRTDGGWKTEVVAGGAHLEYASLEVGRQGKVRASFACGSSLDGLPPGVYYAESEGGPWTLERVDGAAHFSTRSSLALDGDDVPYIAYYELDRSDQERELYRLKVARRSGGEWSVVTVEEMELFDLITPDERIAITFGSRGRPCVAYLEQTGPTAYVKAARLVGGEWPAPSP
jgi:hypothetical protein